MNERFRELIYSQPNRRTLIPYEPQSFLPLVFKESHFPSQPQFNSSNPHSNELIPVTASLQIRQNSRAKSRRSRSPVKLIDAAAIEYNKDYRASKEPKTRFSTQKKFLVGGIALILLIGLAVGLYILLSPPKQNQFSQPVSVSPILTITPGKAYRPPLSRVGTPSPDIPSQQTVSNIRKKSVMPTFVNRIPDLVDPVASPSVNHQAVPEGSLQKHHRLKISQ